MLTFCKWKLQQGKMLATCHRDTVSIWWTDVNANIFLQSKNITLQKLSQWYLEYYLLHLHFAFFKESQKNAYLEPLTSTLEPNTFPTQFVSLIKCLILVYQTDGHWFAGAASTVHTSFVPVANGMECVNRAVNHRHAADPHFIIKSACPYFCVDIFSLVIFYYFVNNFSISASV